MREMNVSFEGFKVKALTFTVTEHIAPGSLVRPSGDGSVEPCTGDDDFCGIVLACRDGVACVQTDGYVELPYNGLAPDPGYCSVQAYDSASIKRTEFGADAVSAGRKLLILTVDTNNGVCGLVM